MAKLILTVLDGVSAKEGFQKLGFLNSLIEQGLGACYKVCAELPTMSRPLYETLQTGLRVKEHGIMSNVSARPSQSANLFSRSKKAGLTTGAAAYHWVSELYDAFPFNPARNRFSFREDKGEEGDIDYGIYYWNDDYPVQACFADAAYILKKYAPDYLLLHPMNSDYAGHKFGGDSKEYGLSIIESDVCLAETLPLWLKAGYQVIVTADHGMNVAGFHGGVSSRERMVPLYIFAEGIKKGNFKSKTISQLQIAPLCARILRLPDSEKEGEFFFA